MVEPAKKYQELTELWPEIARCGRCGFCQSVCPVYHASPLEGSVARGRNMFARELVSGALDLNRRNEAFFSECLLCRACVDMCFSAVKTDEIVLAGRRIRQRVYGTSRTRAYLFDRLLPDHHRFGKIIRFVAATRGATFTRITSALRMCGWFAPARIANTLKTFEYTDQLLSSVPETFLRDRLVKREKTGAGSQRIAFFIGCGINFMFPQAGEATVAVLEALGYDVAVMENGCCGLPALVDGSLETAQRLAIQNMSVLSDMEECAIVTDCSSCASFLKDYPKLFSGGNEPDRTKLSEAEAFSSRVCDVTEILGEKDFGREIERGKRELNVPVQRVAFHEPCHLSRYQKLSSAARRILRSLPGIDFAEMKEAEWCCGGAGAFAVEHPELSLKILERKIQNIRSAGADTVVTTCPSCLMQLRSGLREADVGIRTRHLVEIALECLLRENKS